MYKPYSPEWHRHRYLKEAIDKYLDDYVDNDIIIKDPASGLPASPSRPPPQRQIRVQDPEDKSKGENK